MTALSSSLPDTYEERLAIAYYDGGQGMKLAKRMSYLENFADVLITLPYEGDSTSAEEDWLDQRIRKAKDWLESQGINQSS